MDTSLDVFMYFMNLKYDSTYILNIPDSGWSDLASSNDAYSLRVPQFLAEIKSTVVSNAGINAVSGNSKSLINMIIDTDLKKKHRGVYEIVRLVLFECWSLTYIMDTDASYTKDMSLEDLDLLVLNINWICNFMGDYRKYRKFIEYFRDLEISVGYMRNQFGLIINSDDLKYSLESYKE